MDGNAYSMPKDDLMGVLRTILMFLENINFQNTSKALQNEWVENGYPESVLTPCRITPCLPTQSKTTVSSACASLRNQQTEQNSHKSNKSVSDIYDEQIPTLLTNSSNHSVRSGKKPVTTESKTSTVGGPDFTSERYEQTRGESVREHKSISTEACVLTDNRCCVEALNKYEELQMKFALLQEEHKKLSGVASELTAALQNSIIGQSQKLTVTLSKCREIYPNLFETQNKTDFLEEVEEVRETTSEVTLKQPSDDDELQNDEIEDEDNLQTLMDADLDGDFSVHGWSNNDFNASTPSNTTVVVPAVSQTPSKAVSFQNIEFNGSNELNPHSVASGCWVAVNEEKEQASVIFDTDEDKRLVKSASHTSVVTEQSERRVKSGSSVSVVSQRKSNTEVSVDEKSFLVPKICNSSEKLSSKRSSCSLRSLTSSRDYFEINYCMLKDDLLRNDNNRKLLILQALRWRITKSPQDIRQTVISSYIKSDILELHTSCNSHPCLFLETLYCPKTEETPHPLQEAVARLVNAFASLNVGRDYLTQNDCLLINILLPLILGTSSECKLSVVTRDMLFATLQKLSLRNRQRQQMITAGLVQFLIRFLSLNYKSASVYCLEYCTALLMNLCLHKEAREICRSQPGEVVALLTNLLERKFSYCMPYVNGTMYSLLSDPYINAEAKKQGLGDLILQQLKCTKGEIHKQLDFIYKIHFQSNSRKLCMSPEPESEEEFDLLEDELDQNDTVSGAVKGETLLLNYELDSSVNKDAADPDISILRRPITPHPKSANNSANESLNNSIFQLFRNLPIPSQVSLAQTSNHDINESIESYKHSMSSEIILVKPPDDLNQQKTQSEPIQSSGGSSPVYKKRVFARNARNKVPQSFTRAFGTPKREKPPPEGMETQTPSMFNNFRLCYREAPPQNGFFPSMQCVNRHCSCKNMNYCGCDNFNKYMCGCYEAIKAYVENSKVFGEDEMANGHPSAKYCRSDASTEPTQRDVATKTDACSCDEGEDDLLDFPSQCDVPDVHIGLDIVCDHKCSSNKDSFNKCKYYKTVFQSRPKIIRTPP